MHPNEKQQQQQPKQLEQQQPKQLEQQQLKQLKPSLRLVCKLKLTVWGTCEYSDTAPLGLGQQALHALGRLAKQQGKKFKPNSNAVSSCKKGNMTGRRKRRWWWRQGSRQEKAKQITSSVLGRG